MKNQTKPISIRLQADGLCFSEGDPYTKVIPFTGDILFDDDQDGIRKVGELLVTTTSVNLLDMAHHDIEVFDCYDFHHANAFFTLIDQDSCKLKYDVLSKDIKDELFDIDKVNILYIQAVVLHKDFRGFNVTEQVLGVLKVVFNNHLFFLKAYPLQFSKQLFTAYDDLYSLPNTNKSSSIKKLVSLYSKNGFTELNSKDSYMVLLNI